VSDKFSFLKSGRPASKHTDPKYHQITAASKSDLTAREWEIILLLADGQASKEIALALGISVATVSSHRKSLCRKLNVHSVAELIRSAIAIVGASQLHFLVLPRVGDCRAVID